MLMMKYKIWWNLTSHKLAQTNNIIYFGTWSANVYPQFFPMPYKWDTQQLLAQKIRKKDPVFVVDLGGS